MSSSRYGAAGLHLLSTLAFCSAGFITLAGLSLFSSVIAEEKEEQTIGLLRMAGLRPLAILFAKCGARLLDVMLLIGVLVPFALLAVTLGGVSATQVMACIVALGAYASSCSRISGCCCRWCGRPRRAPRHG